MIIYITIFSTARQKASTFYYDLLIRSSLNVCVCAALFVYGTTHRTHVSMCWLVTQLQSEAWCGTQRSLTSSFQVKHSKSTGWFSKDVPTTNCFVISVLSVSALLNQIFCWHFFQCLKKWQTRGNMTSSNTKCWWFIWGGLLICGIVLKS